MKTVLSPGVDINAVGISTTDLRGRNQDLELKNLVALCLCGDDLDL